MADVSHFTLFLPYVLMSTERIRRWATRVGDQRKSLENRDVLYAVVHQAGGQKGLQTLLRLEAWTGTSIFIYLDFVPAEARL